MSDLYFFEESDYFEGNTSGALRCVALCDLVPFVKFKKREKHPWRSVTFSASAFSFTKSKTPPWVFFTFFKLCTWYCLSCREFVRMLTASVKTRSVRETSCEASHVLALAREASHVLALPT